jgi:hypothetical protein
MHHNMMWHSVQWIAAKGGQPSAAAGWLVHRLLLHQ